MKKWIIPAALLFGGTAALGAADEAARGKTLFESSRLGTNGKSCAVCHPGGKGIEVPTAMPDDELAAAVNTCVTKALKGKDLDPDSPEMKELLRYIRTLSAS